MKTLYKNAFLTILRSEIQRFSRIWIQTLLPPTITITLYFIIFGNLIGQRIGEMRGFPYILYIAPGLIIMSVITNAYANVVSSFFSARFQKSIEEILISPIPNSLILIGYIAGGIARGMIIGILITIIALFFTHLKIYSLLVIISIALCAAMLFALAGFTNAVFAKKFDDISIIPTFVITPLTYLGGVFYSVDLLPPLWHYLSLANPILYMVNGFRYGMLGISDVSLLWTFILLISFIIALFAFNLYLLKKGVGIKS